LVKAQRSEGNKSVPVAVMDTTVHDEGKAYISMDEEEEATHKRVLGGGMIGAKRNAQTIHRQNASSVLPLVCGRHVVCCRPVGW